MRRQKMRVGLVIPVKNDGSALEELLISLKNQSRQPDEIVIVLAESTDGSVEIAKKWQKKWKNIRVLVEPFLNRSQARNHGAITSNSEIIVFTDAGCIPDTQWLAKLVEPFEINQVELVGGFTKGRWSTAFEEAQIPFVLVPLKKVEKHPLPATRNMAIARKLFLETGGFREDLNFAEDFEFSRRLRDRGSNAVFVADAKVSWRPRSNLSEFFRMIFSLTFGDLQAGILRLGLMTMWLRYLFFTVLFILNPLLGLLTLSAYLTVKTGSFEFTQPLAYFYAAILQVFCDMAVLSASLAFVLHKRDNTNNAD